MVGNKQEKGFALILAIGATALISMAVLLAGNHLQSRCNAHQTEIRDVKLIAYTDGALAETLAKIATDGTFGGIERRRFGDGSIESSVRWVDDQTFVITAESRFGSWTGRLVAQGHLATEGPRIDLWKRSLSTA